MTMTSVTALIAVTLIASAGHAEPASSRHHREAHEPSLVVTRARAFYREARFDARLARAHSNARLWAGPDAPATESVSGDAAPVHDHAPLERALA